MSQRLFTDDVLFFQRLLRAERLYLDDLDGKWGSLTEAAALMFEQNAETIKSQTRAFDSRSEQNLATLSLKSQREARIFLAKVLDAGIGARIISGSRTYTEQNVLYRKGRFGNAGPIVTKARGGYSNHNFGIAWDIGIFTTAGGYLEEGAEYDRAANVGLLPSLEWGGNWKSLVDRPHYQLRVNMTVNVLRAAFEAGEPIAAFI